MAEGKKPVSKKQQACVNRYMSAHYDRINITVPKGKREIVKAHADKTDGGNVNGFIQRAIREQMQRDNEKDEPQ